MENNNGLSVAVIGGIIAALSMVVLVAGLGEAHYENWGAARVLLALGLLGGLAGGTAFLSGIPGALSNWSKERSSGRLKRCHHCGSRLEGNPKTCEFCGVDVKQP